MFFINERKFPDSVLSISVKKKNKKKHVILEHILIIHKVNHKYIDKGTLPFIFNTVRTGNSGQKHVKQTIQNFKVFMFV